MYARARGRGGWAAGPGQVLLAAVKRHNGQIASCLLLPAQARPAIFHLPPVSSSFLLLLPRGACLPQGQGAAVTGCVERGGVGCPLGEHSVQPWTFLAALVLLVRCAAKHALPMMCIMV